MFFISLQLTKNDVEFLPIEISSKKARASKGDFSTIKITSKRVTRNTVDISTREIISKKVRGNYVDFSTIEINCIEKSMWKQRGFFDHRNYIQKVRGNDVEIRRNLVYNVST